MENTNTTEIPSLPPEANVTQSATHDATLPSLASTVQAPPRSKKKIIIWSLVGIVALPVIVFGLIFSYGMILGYKEVLNETSKVNANSNPVSTSFASEEKDFKATFPGVPLRKVEAMPMEGHSDLQITSYTASVKTGAFIVTSTSLPISKEEISTIDTKGFLNAAANGAVKEGKTKMDSLTFGKVGDFPSSDVFHSNNEIVIHQRLILIGNSMYQLIVSQEKAKADDSYKAFFDSFGYTGEVTYGASVNKNSMATTSKKLSKSDNKKVALMEFFPLISGHIADYEVDIPKDYMVHYVSINDAELGSSPLSSNSLVGVSDDIDDLLSQAKQGGAISFKDTSRGVFRARFTATTGLDEKGRFVDKTNGPINELMYKNMGMTNVVFKNGLFRNIKGVPTVTITGELQGSHVRMLYLYSSVDNLTVLFSLQGGQDQADDDALWNTFTNSF